ncbi:MAG: hypothetical protein IJ718_02775 [Paludibacteraceae bacterium]|nr:hypothetical protein [Paludibacteraceae bacterium]
MDIVDSIFKSDLNDFFTKKNCNNWSKEEDDFQKRVAKFLVGKGYQVLREVVVKAEDVPEIKSKLDLKRRRIDIVAYKNERFYFVELKFENVTSQERHVTKDSYEKDKEKSLPIYRYFSDIAVIFRRVLTNNPAVMKDLGGKWNPLEDGDENKDAFMWQGDHIDEKSCKHQADHTFCGIWNGTVCERLEKGFEEGDKASYVDNVE